VSVEAIAGGLGGDVELFHFLSLRVAVPAGEYLYYTTI